MKTLVSILLIFSIQALAVDPLRLGFMPGGEALSMKKAVDKISQALQKELNLPVQASISSSYSQLILDLKDQKMDFAMLNAFGFVENEEKLGLKVLLKKIWEAPYYYSTLMTLGSSKYKKIQDLKGARVAFVDTKSTSGYLYPQLALKKYKMTEKDFSKLVFSGSHKESVSLLENKQVDVIAVFSDDPEVHISAWQKYAQNPKLATRSLWVSEAIPNDPFVVRRDFYEKNPKLTHSLMFALIDVFESLKSDPDVVKVFEGQSFLPATTRQYDSVREMIKVLGPLKQQ